MANALHSIIPSAIDPCASSAVWTTTALAIHTVLRVGTDAIYAICACSIHTITIAAFPTNTIAIGTIPIQAIGAALTIDADVRTVCKKATTGAAFHIHLVAGSRRSGADAYITGNI